MLINLFHLSEIGNEMDSRDYGISIYRGVLIKWNAMRDLRVPLLIDSMPIKIVEKLLAVCYHNGNVSFLWRGDVPTDYAEYKNVSICGDNWSITWSKKAREEAKK